MEVKYKSKFDNINSLAPLIYITLGLVVVGVLLHRSFLFFAILPTIYLLSQWQELNKKGGNVALIVNAEGIENSWGKFRWEHIKSVKIEKYRGKQELFFIHQLSGESEKHYRYNINELVISSEELYHQIAQYHPIEL